MSPRSEPALAQPPPDRAWRGIALALFAVSTWAIWLPVTRLALTQGENQALTVWDLPLIRFLVATLLLLPVLARKGIPGPKRFHPGRLAIIAGGAGVYYALCATAALSFAPASHGGVLMPGTMPMWVAVLGFLVLRERLSRLRLLGLGAMLLGAVVLGVGELGFGQTAGSDVWKGDLLFMAGALGWASYTVAVRGAGLSTWHVAALVSVLSLIVYVPIWAIFGTSGLAEAGWREIVWNGAFQGVLIAVVSLAAYGRAVALIGPARSSAFAALVPGLATLFAIPILGEWPGPAALVGLAFSSLGVFLASRG